MKLINYNVKESPEQTLIEMSISNGVKNISVKIVVRNKCSHNFQIFKHIYTMNKNVRAFYAFCHKNIEQPKKNIEREYKKEPWLWSFGCQVI